MNEEQIISSFSPIVSKSPGDPRFARLGDAYLKKNDLRRAMEILTAGVGANPTYATGQLILARALAQAGYLKEARERFEIVLRIDPANAAAVWEIAKIDLKQGKDEEGIERLKALLLIDPFDEKAKQELKKLKVDFGETAPPPPPSATEQAVEEKRTATTPAPPPTTEIEFDKVKGGAALASDEISSIEKELEELLKMDISGEEAAGLDMEEMASGEDFAVPHVAPELDMMPSEAFEPPQEQATAMSAEQALEEVVSSLEEGMPAFDLEKLDLSISEPTQKKEAPRKEPESEEPQSLEELPSFEISEPTKTTEVVTPPETEDLPSFDMQAPTEDDFDFTPPSQETPAPEPSAQIEEQAIDDSFEFTPPSEAQPESEDFFDFTPPEKPKAPKEKPSSMADALKELEIEEAPVEPPAKKSVELGTTALTSEKPIEEPLADEEEKPDEPSYEVDIPSLDIETPPEIEENLTSIGGYHFTDTIAEKPTDPNSDDDGIEFRHEFHPTEEPLELEGFIGTSEFVPPDESASGPEFADLEFADELDGIAPEPEIDEEAEEITEEHSGEELSEEPDLLTVTMAEIHAGQGNFKKAISIYKAILKKTRDDNEVDRIEKRIEHLTKLLSSGVDGASSD